MTEEETRMITNGKQSIPLSQDSEVALTSFEGNSEDNHHPHDVILMNPEEDNDEENHVRKKKRKESSSSSSLKCSCLTTSSTLSLIAVIFISCVIFIASSSSIFASTGMTRSTREASIQASPPPSSLSTTHLHIGNEINHRDAGGGSTTSSSSSTVSLKQDPPRDSFSETDHSLGSESNRKKIEKPANNSPVIESRGQMVTVRQNDSVILPCEVRDLGEYTIIWQKDKSRVLFANDMRIHPDPRFTRNNVTHALQINNVNEGDAGQYMCSVSTMALPNINHTVRVLVPPSIAVFPNETRISVKSGERVEMSCNSKGIPTPNVSWKRHRMEDGRDIWTDPHQGTTLNIVNATRMNIGSYECRATNEVGEATATFKLEVLYQPEVEVDNKVMHTGRGVDTVITCRVFAEPKPQVTWSRERDSRQINVSTDKFILEERGTEYRLKIMRVEPEEDFDNYTCHAGNKFGFTVGNIELVGFPMTARIISRPTVYSPFASYEVKWEVASNAPVTEFRLRYRRQRLNDSVEEDDWNEIDSINATSIPLYGSYVYSQGYKLTKLDWATTYEVQVEARNEFGWNRPNEAFPFKVLAGPLTANDASSSPLHLTSSGHASLLSILVSFLLLQVILSIDQH